MKNKGLALLFTVLVVPSSCSLRPSPPPFSLSEVIVLVKTEYHEEFTNRNITVEDFVWENVSELSYHEYYPEYHFGGKITVSLKKHGVKRVESAIEHFKKLDFIEDADKVHYLTIQ